MKVVFQAPSKTFLVGEYAALVGGPCLVLNTEPCFQGQVKLRGEGLAEGIHPESPAGLWIRENRTDFEDVDLKFVDPHKGAGGFGASGAQFLFAWAWSQTRGQRIESLSEELDQQKLLDDFLAVHSDSSSLPSGADLISQWNGHLTQIQNLKPVNAWSSSWPFADLDIILIPTGNKLKTHPHLKSLEKPGLLKLKDISSQAVMAFANKDEGAFLEALNRFAAELRSQGKLAENSKDLLFQFADHEGVVAAKGCGAMGSDVILLVVEKNKFAAVSETMKSLGLNGFSAVSQGSGGLSFEMSWKSQVRSKPVLRTLDL